MAEAGFPNQVVVLPGNFRYRRQRWRSPAGSGGHELERLTAAIGGPAPNRFKTGADLPSLQACAGDEISNRGGLIA
jgi:hypothetical protein